MYGDWNGYGSAYESDGGGDVIGNVPVRGKKLVIEPGDVDLPVGVGVLELAGLRDCCDSGDSAGEPPIAAIYPLLKYGLRFCRSEWWMALL